MDTSELDLTYKPTGYSYRVSRNIWAGEYPVWDWDMGGRITQLRLYTGFGITDFLDLTESGEMPPYAELLPWNISRHTFPVANGMVPQSVEAVVRLFEKITTLFAERPDCHLYIHCHGGVGRTGTIVACYFIWFERLSFEEALEKMRSHFAFHGRSTWMNAPENQQQIDFVRNFAETCNDWR